MNLSGKLFRVLQRFIFNRVPPAVPESTQNAFNAADLRKLMHALLKANGFRKISYSNWSLKRETITLHINLQKSGYSNYYYLNYGYSFNDLQHKDVPIHIDKRLHVAASGARASSDELFDLDRMMPGVLRQGGIQEVFTSYLLPEMLQVYTKQDVLNVIQKLPTKDIIPGFVRQYLSI